MKTRTIALLLGALATTLALAGCSAPAANVGDGSSPSASNSSESSSANSADVALAQKIIDDQTAEIALMKDILDTL